MQHGSVSWVLAWHSQSLEFNPQNCTKNRQIAHAFNPSPQKVETRGSEIQDHLLLRGKFQASLGYRKLSEKKEMGKEVSGT